ISVKDNGAGLSPEKVSQLFQPFNRLGQEAGVQEGTGIGLVVAKQLIELMGGVIGVESTVGNGSVFWFDLTATNEPQLHISASEPLIPALAPAPAGPHLRNVLYIEDNPANLKLVQQLLERRTDLRLLSAGDGREGITLARAYMPDVILMDINLPGISGIETLRLLREDPLTANITVVAISANAMPRDIEKGLEAGFFSYLTKPIKVKEFIEVLDAALKNSQKPVAVAA
ncbi:MAG: hypothetical protein QOJ40_2598, partial [Verrucomicrobiota bacterium]